MSPLNIEQAWGTERHRLYCVSGRDAQPPASPSPSERPSQKPCEGLLFFARNFPFNGAFEYIPMALGGKRLKVTPACVIAGRYSPCPLAPIHIVKCAMTSVTTKAPPLRSHIAIEDEVEAKYWVKHLGVTRDELQRVVDKVGNSQPLFAKNWKQSATVNRLQ